MAIQAQLYSDNIGFTLCSSYDYNGGNGSDGFNSFHFGPQWKPQLQFQEQLQNHEIDEFIKSQDERLRLLLQEQRNQQVSTMVKKLESKASFLEEEITKAKNRTMELQILMNKLEMENQTWQRVAQENEAMVVSLNNMLQQLQQQLDNGVDDAGSCCEETEENRGFGVVERTMMVCRCCDSRNSCVLFLPCRHLCTCKDCAAFLDCCPVCRTIKKASIEALVS
ncbi:hypothetical protein ES319_A03G221300v1 [Gossypium barbadense]|uniref:RING-type domain-containing protein n=3 Tax=Gossypium TaxID=3633 RepID=A0A5J5WKI6_GOSBA|nr:hypothetical protein ES319_A03G221300v1 [Gossypium barbadense]TYH26382.1 hypothetical protein ES288_A03G247700v1 [Gossypium darwinii]TYI37832.1 hypothetical protein ES332_A03G242200v1 [Gossypium tomentosum]